MLVPAELLQATGGYEVLAEVVAGEEGDVGDQVLVTLPGKGGARVAFRLRPDPTRWVAFGPGFTLHVAGGYQVVEALERAGAGTIPVPAGEAIDASALRRST